MDVGVAPPGSPLPMRLGTQLHALPFRPGGLSVEPLGINPAKGHIPCNVLAIEEEEEARRRAAMWQRPRAEWCVLSKHRRWLADVVRKQAELNDQLQASNDAARRRRACFVAAQKSVRMAIRKRGAAAVWCRSRSKEMASSYEEETRRTSSESVLGVSETPPLSSADTSTTEKKSGGSVETASGGAIETASGGSVETASGGSVETASGGPIKTASGGSVGTANGGSIETAGGVSVNTKFDRCRRNSNGEHRRRSKALSTKLRPTWALTEREADEREETEMDELLSFANGLDYHKYMDDMEVQVLAPAARLLITKTHALSSQPHTRFHRFFFDRIQPSHTPLLLGAPGAHCDQGAH